MAYFKSLGSNVIKNILSRSFDRGRISLAVREVYHPVIKQFLNTKIENTPFSFTIDSTTWMNESLTALKIKYVDDDGLKDKLLSLTKLEETSTSEVYFEIIKQNISQGASKNCNGWAHDRAMVLTGTKTGLSAKLNSYLPPFHLNLLDPIHSA